MDEEIKERLEQAEARIRRLEILVGVEESTEDLIVRQHRDFVEKVRERRSG